MTNDHATKNMLVFLTGFAAGSAVGILLAPTSGHRTRRQITRGVEDAQDYFAGLGEELIERGQELIQQSRERTSSKRK